MTQDFTKYVLTGDIFSMHSAFIHSSNMEAVLSDNGAKPMDIKDGQLAEKTADDKGTIV